MHGRQTPMVHKRRRLILGAVGLAALLLASSPGGSASWMAFGTREPDTADDVAARRMWTDPDTAPGGARVYFDLFQTPVATTMPLNVAALGTRVFAEPASQFEAILGVWKDCDHDGYVGNGASGLLEYRAELLLSTSPCFVDRESPTPFNDGQWVVELISIGAVDPCSFRDAAFRSAHCGGIAAYRRDPVTINSNDTKVWLDLGRPGARASDACTLVPPPRSTTASTGGLLAYATCFDDERELVVLDQALRALDPDDQTGLYFDDPHRPQDSDSLLDQHFPVNLFGDATTGRAGLFERGTGDPTFTAFDCEPGTNYTPIRGLDVDPTDNRTLDPRTGAAPPGSLWDATEITFEHVAGDCDRSTDNAMHAVVYERTLARARSADPPPGELRSRADDVLTFASGSRGARVDLATGLPTDETAGVASSLVNATADAAYGPRGPRDAGAPYARAQAQGPLWSSRLVWQRAQTGQPIFVTAYVALNTSDVQRYQWLLPTMVPGSYGAEACGGATSGERNGWQCDPARWYVDAAGADTMPYTAGGADDGKPLGPRAGELYLAMDVDCYDGHLATVAGVDVQLSIEKVTNASPCA